MSGVVWPDGDRGPKDMAIAVKQPDATFQVEPVPVIPLSCVEEVLGRLDDETDEAKSQASHFFDTEDQRNSAYCWDGRKLGLTTAADLLRSLIDSAEGGEDG